jgi:hypothetical protein
MALKGSGKVTIPNRRGRQNGHNSCLRILSEIGKSRFFFYFLRQCLLNEDSIIHTCQLRSSWNGVAEEEHN